MYLDATGAPLSGGKPVAGRRSIVENYDLRSAIPAIARGEPSVAGWIGSLRGASEAAWFARDGVGPLLPCYSPRSSTWRVSVVRAPCGHGVPSHGWSASAAR